MTDVTQISLVFAHTHCYVRMRVLGPVDSRDPHDTQDCFVPASGLPGTNLLGSHTSLTPGNH